MQRHPTSAIPPDVRAWARSGAMSLTGRSDGPPLCPRTSAASLVDQLAAPFGLDSGVLSERAGLTGWRRNGRVTLGGAGRLLRARDGWVALSLPRREDVQLVPALLAGDESVGQDPWVLIEQTVAERSADEMLDRARLLGLAAAVVGGESARPLPSWWPRAAAATSDLSGCTVVDLSALWAGPLCTHLLHRAGARVIKVESTSRPDGARWGDPDFHDLLNAGKESVALDLTSATGREALRRLVARADVVVTSARARAVVGLGLDPDDVCARPQAPTWVMITGHGWAEDSVAFGDDAAAGAGLVAWDASGAPCFAGDAIADPLCGVVAAAAVVQGAQGLVDISLHRVAAATVAAADGGHVAPQEIPSSHRVAGEWFVGDEPVAAARIRRPTGPAAALGVDTGPVLDRVGL